MPLGEGTAIPGGDFAASPFDNGNDGQNIPGVENRIDHDICSAGDQQEIAVTVAPRAAELRCSYQLFPAPGLVVVQ